jgi:hypothetical protein
VGIIWYREQRGKGGECVEQTRYNKSELKAIKFTEVSICANWTDIKEEDRAN